MEVHNGGDDRILIIQGMKNNAVIKLVKVKKCHLVYYVPENFTMGEPMCLVRAPQKLIVLEHLMPRVLCALNSYMDFDES